MMNNTAEMNALKMRLVPTDKATQTANIVPKGATMIGNTEASEDLNIRIDGEYEGKIDMMRGGSVFISADATVSTEMLVADYIYVEGTVKGNLHARVAIELSPTARVSGSIRYEKDLDIHPGAKVSGQISATEIDD